MFLKILAMSLKLFSPPNTHIVTYQAINLYASKGILGIKYWHGLLIDLIYIQPVPR